VDVNGYPPQVRMMFARLLLVVAVLLMPFGMAPASAVSTHDRGDTAMAMGHCPDGSQDHRSKAGIAECTMACAAALPVIVGAADEPMLVHPDRVAPPLAHRLHGLHPETATPPPRLS
jgi:hypothetical protein